MVLEVVWQGLSVRFTRPQPLANLSYTNDHSSIISRLRMNLFKRGL